MVQKLTTAEVMTEARKNVASYAVFRVESAVIIALTLLLTGLAILDIGIPRAYWWLVILVGIGAEAAIIASTLHDKQFLAKISARMFYQRLNTNNIANIDLRRNMTKGMELHQQIFKAISARPNAPLGQVAQHMDDWVASMYAVTHGLDTFVSDPTIVERLNHIADEPEHEIQRINDDSDTLSIIVSAQQQRQDSPARQSLLDDVREVVTHATRELDGSLRGMGAIQHQLHTSNPMEIDWAMAQGMSVMICDHMNQLRKADTLIESLFSTYCGDKQLSTSETIETDSESITHS